MDANHKKLLPDDRIINSKSSYKMEFAKSYKMLSNSAFLPLLSTSSKFNNSGTSSPFVK